MQRHIVAVRSTLPKAFYERSVSYDFDTDDFNPFPHKLTREVHYYRKRRVRLNDLRACGLLPPRPDPYFCDDDIDLSV
uniref:Uncharacterized protein n=1 Tax=Steinernema glaseri TaxID=37863 RepID=A0A1I7ZLI7_9BILA